MRENESFAKINLFPYLHRRHVKLLDYCLSGVWVRKEKLAGSLQGPF